MRTPYEPPLREVGAHTAAYGRGAHIADVHGGGGWVIGLNLFPGRGLSSGPGPRKCTIGCERKALAALA